MKTTDGICSLADADRVAGCGGKAAALARLLRLGLPVPPGIVVTDAVFQAFRAGALPESFAAALHSRLALFAPHATLIVRSSALGEDGEAASFAGQLDSILDVDPRSGLLPALRACWASYESPRVLAYQRARGIRLVGMGVIVQEQIRPRFAGVLFTNTPEPGGGAADDLLIEYCPGHGEALVQGRINPGRAVVRRSDLRVRHLSLPEEGSSPPELGELARLGLAVEAACGRPQDIEWALDAAGRPWLVQARPVTTAPPLVLWSNANVNENYPGPISPLLYSIARSAYYHYFRNLGLAFGLAPARLATVEGPLQQIIGVHGARMYYHLTNIHTILQAAPFGARLAQFFSAFTGAEPPAADRPEGFRWGACLEAARVAVTAVRRFRTLPRRVAEFEAMVDAFAERTHPDRLAAASLSELLEALRGFLDIRFRRWTNAGLADAAAMISYGLLKHLLRREFPAAEQAALHNTLLKGLTDVVSGQPQAELWELSRLLRVNPSVLNSERNGFHAALDRYVERWGYRRSGELMLTVPDFQEQPGPLLDLLRAYAAQDGEAPAERLQRQQAERTTETERVLGILRGRRVWRWLPWPSMASIVARVLRWCQAAISLRERARMRQALLYGRCRAIALAIGRQLTARGDFEQTEDVFFLTYQEIDEFLSGGAMFPKQVRDLVRLRRQAHREVSAVKPPDVLRLPVGASFVAGGTEIPPDDGEAALTGVGACGGQVRGRAVVLEDVTDCQRLTGGEVLVTRQTDPGWGLAFPLIRGLVLERGGMLSHGAILAHEYGIPTVVGVRDAARRIRSGQVVQVDGDRGVVHLVDH